MAYDRGMPDSVSGISLAHHAGAPYDISNMIPGERCGMFQSADMSAENTDQMKKERKIPVKMMTAAKI